MLRDEMSGSLHSHTLDQKIKIKKAFQLPKDTTALISLINNDASPVFFLFPKL